MLTIDSTLENGFKITPKDPSTTELRILQVTDMHMGHIKLGKWRILKDIKKICDHFNVDFVMNTGDLFCNCRPHFYLNKILHDFDSQVNLPWAFAWGNHDCENFDQAVKIDNIGRLSG